MRAAFILLSISFASHSAAAGVSLSGSVVALPNVVKTVDADGKPHEYQVRALRMAYVRSRHVMLTSTGAMSMCGDNLGQLAEDFSFKIQGRDSSVKVVSIQKTAGERQVSAQIRR